MDVVRAQAESFGVVSTLLGRKLKVVGAQSKSGMDKQAALCAAINAPMQGSASDIIKLAMVHLDQKLESSTLPARLLLQVHDELVLEVDPSVIDPVKTLVINTMEQAVKLSVPLLVETGIGSNWMDAK